MCHSKNRERLKREGSQRCERTRGGRTNREKGEGEVDEESEAERGKERVLRS